jgi:ectoine hydroxylase-related dioxygenase (phytanoyl-CoA dioxygenase family)
MVNLVDDERIHQIPESLLGPDFWLDGSEGHLRVDNTPWHADTSTADDIDVIKVAAYLDPLTEETGCLRVIPGTHTRGSPDRFADLRDREDARDFRPFGMAPDQIESVALETDPGDILVFTEKVIHGSFGGGRGRHQICVSFISDITTEKQREEIAISYRNTKKSFRPTRTYINSDRPRIRRMVQRPLEMGFEVLEV